MVASMNFFFLIPKKKIFSWIFHLLLPNKTQTITDDYHLNKEIYEKAIIFLLQITFSILCCFPGDSLSSLVLHVSLIFQLQLLIPCVAACFILLNFMNLQDMCMVFFHQHIRVMQHQTFCLESFLWDCQRQYK